MAHNKKKKDNYLYFATPCLQTRILRVKFKKSTKRQKHVESKPCRGKALQRTEVKVSKKKVFVKVVTLKKFIKLSTLTWDLTVSRKPHS